MSYKLSSGMTYRLPSFTATPEMRGANADQLKVLLCLAQQGYNATIDNLAKGCGMSLSATACALEYWLESGIVETLDAPSQLTSDELIHGTAAEDARVIGEEELHGCLETCAQIMGKLLNPAEINALVAILTNLGVTEDYLITLLDFCVNRMGKQHIRYVEKTAVGLYDQGIHTLEALNDYIRRYDAIHSVEGQIRKMWGIGARAFTKAEETHLNRWLNEFRYGLDIIGIAYDITVNNLGKAPFSYANKLMSSWHQNGLKTASEIEAYLEEQKKSGGKKAPAKPKQQLATSSFDITSAFEIALQRSYGDQE